MLPGNNFIDAIRHGAHTLQQLTFFHAIVFHRHCACPEGDIFFRCELDYVIGNWQLNGIADVRSGLPVNLTVSGDIANTGNVGYMRPNVIGDWHVDNPTPARWFNTAAFRPAAPFTFGNSSRTIPNVQAPGLTNVDFSIFKDFHLTERFALQFRAAAFNLTG